MGSSTGNQTPEHDESYQRRLSIDPHYTVSELEWHRIVGPSGMGTELLGEMAALSSGEFDFEPRERIPTDDGERIEFAVDGMVQSVQFDYDVSPTSTLMHGLRHLFGKVNTALRRAGIGWRFVLLRRRGSSAAFNYRLVMSRQCTRLPHEDDVDVVAGLELKEFELE
jgi:hypothetical protein